VDLVKKDWITILQPYGYDAFFFMHNKFLVLTKDSFEFSFCAMQCFTKRRISSRIGTCRSQLFYTYFS